MSEAIDVPGWSDLIARFGGTPTFHDAEVLGFDLHRDPDDSVLRVHTWRMTSDLDERGYFILDQHVVVSFILTRISVLELSGWMGQNVLFGLEITHDARDHQIELDSSFGVGGVIAARGLRIEYEPLDKPRAVVR